ncbi:MAG: dockerin type I repeat-containing protein, partial [Clostridiales bacterium]|nr:dockerin type I repeat-containing protein [Clostridiales bacterium]
MKKRILSILLTLCMVLMLVPATAFAETLIGDIDRDGDVTVKDAVCLQNYLDGLISFTDEEFLVADFNGDGRVNYTDLTELQSYLDFMESSLAITVDGFEVGKTPNDITYSFESTIPGIEFSEDDITRIGWHKYVFDGSNYIWANIPNTNVFEAGASYHILMDLDNKGLDMAPAVTVNGKTPEYCAIATSNGVPIQLLIACTLGTPA